jgi:hypothetical protein
MSDVEKIHPDSEAFLLHFYGEKVVVLTLLADDVVGFDCTNGITTKDLAYMKEVFELFIHDKIRSGE